MRLPPFRRIVTGHDAAGRAVVTDDKLIETMPSPSGVAAFGLVWSTDTSPVNNDDATDGGSRTVGLSLPNGTVMRICDMQPGRRSTMHRTDSLDYGIVLSGTVELELDDGAVTRLEAGSIIVQRGTIHAWRNPSADMPVRLAFVLVGATPATMDGAALPEIMPGPAHDKA